DTRAANVSYTINWGDDKPGAPTSQAITPDAAGNVQISHVYHASGAYTVRLLVTGADGRVSNPASLPVKIVLAEQQGATLLVGGSDANDRVVFTPGAAANSLVVAVNGVAVGTFANPAVVRTLGNGGADTVFLNGTTGADRFVVGGAKLSMNAFTFTGDSVEG